MIITGGTARGRRILSPEGMSARPTASKIRQAIFNILRDKVRNADFLDIFAGSGLMGLEALSRGARSLYCIEESRKLANCIVKSATHLGYEPPHMFIGDFRQILPLLKEREAFDIIFADPPYASPFAGIVVQLIDRFQLLKPEGALVVEHAKDLQFPENLSHLQLNSGRVYGQTGITFFAGAHAPLEKHQPS